MNTEVLNAYPKYDSYKDSGVDWLGEVPKEWTVERLGNLLKEVSDKNYPDLPLLSITRELGVIERDIDDMDSNHNFIPDDLSGYKKIEQGQFGMNKMKAWQGSYGISRYTGIVSPAYYIFNLHPDLNKDFFSLAIRSKLYVSYFGSASDGVRIGQWDLNKTRMRQIRFVIPTLNEQEKIVRFLTKKILQVDQAIDLKQQQIKRLNEYKRIIIQNAVTKGINSDAKMKDSGIAWMGDIPEHWNIKKSKFLFEFSKGLTITKDNLQDSGVLCVNYGEIHSKYGFELRPNEHELKYVDTSYIDSNPRALLNNGDFVFADTSEDIEGSGNFTYINGTASIFAGYHTVIAKPTIEFNSRFVAYIFDSISYRSQIRHRVKGVKVYSITQSMLKNTFIWLPPKQEQENIVNYLDKILFKVTQANDAYKTEIERLKEYKTILINQAVTGKIKVS